MLIRFEVENFRSIREPAELSMIAIDEDRPAARSQENLGASLLTAAGILGPNASGKSNFLDALAWLRSAVADSLRTWDDTIPIEPFAFGDGPSSTSSFALEMLVSGVRFEYLLDLNRYRVAFEALYEYPKGKRRRIFERTGNDLVLQRGLGELSGTRALLTDRSLALSIMRRFDEPSISAFASQLTSTVILKRSLTPSLWRLRGPGLATLRLFDDAQDDDLFSVFPDVAQAVQSSRQRALSLLQLADLGVVDVGVEERVILRESGGPVTSRTPQLVHSSHEERLPFDYRSESAGTRVWFELIGPVLRALDLGALVLFDELDSSLHPALTAQLVHMFQGVTSNPRGAQVLFTTHDTNLLNHLNRDEIWLTEKHADGGTRFAALSDYAGQRVRRSQNIESGYLSGRFGAIPDVSKPEVLRALGLIG